MIDETYQTKNISPWINTCEYIVLHHTWVIGEGNLPVLLWERAAKVSAHYLIKQDWKVIRLAKDRQITRHAWTSKRDWKTNLNKYSIWIEVEWPWFNNNQRHKTMELIKSLMMEFNIPSKNIIRHKDITSRKVDIADEFWNQQYRSYNDFLSSLTNTIMWFYEQVRKKECEKIPTKDRVFQDPKWAVDRLKNLKPNEQLQEVIYLLALLTQRIKK